MRAELACEAVERALCLELYYGGWTRTVEVHAVGFAADDRLVMRVWQTRGGINAIEPPSWKLVVLDDVDRAELSGYISEAPRPGYKRDDPSLKRLVCQA